MGSATLDSSSHSDHVKRRVIVCLDSWLEFGLAPHRICHRIRHIVPHNTLQLIDTYSNVHGCVIRAIYTCCLHSLQHEFLGYMDTFQDIVPMFIA